MDSEATTIEIGMADMKISPAPAVLITRGLGSCLGIVLYDQFKKIGALAHPMLPRINEGRVKSNPYKFVDSAVDGMVEEFKKRECKTSSLTAKVFGGGHMFSSIPDNSVFNIGGRNLEVAKEMLAAHRIRVLVEECGGSHGRTLYFDVGSGQVKVKTLFHGEKVL